VSTPDVLLYDYVASICCQMTRLTLAEKGVAYGRHTVDIMVKAEQFEPWYTVLNPKAVVPTLKIGDEIVTDTMVIVPRIDREFDGPSLTPEAPAERDSMNAIMRDVMSLHYGVLLYAKRLDASGKSPTVIELGLFLRREREKHPERAAALDVRIAGNERMQKVLADAPAVERHVGDAKGLVGRLDAALAGRDFVSASHWTLADAFATAALARFRLHGFGSWWGSGENANVAAYYERMKERPSFADANVIDKGSERDL
jgi:glutathione S-transferase